MAYKAFSLFSFTLLLLPLHSYATSQNSHEKKLSLFEFLKHLQGCHKGDKVKGIHNLKAYLENFGYLSYSQSKNQTHTNGDDFDELLESAIKTYQLNYHLNATGTMDAKTISSMMMPRCGPGSRYHQWDELDALKQEETSPPPWFFSHEPRAQAFQTWAANTHFTFSRTQDYTNADLKISFHKGDHGDGNPFNGAGGSIAHAFSPTDGRFHYDADEQWSVEATPGVVSYETVALHEIGHLLGLEHSSVEGAIMWPRVRSGVIQGLHRDDIDGIKASYNF
ncbi:metalloendoproteinase 2-mmp [Quercus suber]|uniref:Metalloendoproteinase 2-mmp n=1 Tax=Quercus suber TaxID=58331 RepID=A0AAW0L6U8_QUESU